jgi:hypothetical protein
MSTNTNPTSSNTKPRNTGRPLKLLAAALAGTAATLSLPGLAAQAAAQTAPVEFEPMPWSQHEGTNRGESCSFEADVRNVAGETVTVTLPDGQTFTVAPGATERARLHNPAALNGFTINETTNLVFDVDGRPVEVPNSVAARCATPVEVPETPETPSTTVPTPTPTPTPTVPALPTVPTVPTPTVPEVPEAPETAPPVQVLNDCEGVGCDNEELAMTGAGPLTDDVALGGLATLILGGGLMAASKRVES